MPELAEVEAVRRRIEETLVGKKIREVVLDRDDRYMFAFAKPADVVKALEGAKVTGTGRKGKYFWLELNRKPWPLFHLGMSGNLSVREAHPKASHRRVWGGIKQWSEQEAGPHGQLWFCRLLLIADKGLEIGILDPRRFGRMWLTDDPSSHPRVKALGFDPLLDFPTAAALAKLLEKRKKPIKSVLLEQKIFAGVGNWLADEILYRARLSPHRKASELKPAEVKTLRAAVVGVVRDAVKVNADYERFPKTWLFHHRWGKAKDARTSRGQKIIHEDIGGRTAAWVPGYQK